MILQVKNNRGSGIAVVIYGVVLMLLLIFTAINILNAKVIENAYNSLRDSVLAASSGSVIHLLTTNDTNNMTKGQSNVISNNNYDVYLQLALGYIINRTNNNSGTAVQGAEVNNFIKLDHKKVVNSTMAILDDAVMRNRKTSLGDRICINDTDKFKILMFFIEPHYNNTSYEKYFDIIMYTNGDCDENGVLNTAVEKENKFVGGGEGSMEMIYHNIERSINIAANSAFPDDDIKLSISLNANGGSLDNLVRRMETMPYYVIVVKDFALPTIFNGVETNTEENNIFTFLSGNGSLNTPMCALNSGKTERKLKE